MAFPSHEITTRELVSHLRANQPELPHSERGFHVLFNTTVERRRFSQPLTAFRELSDFGERNRAAFQSLLDLSERASLQALTQLDLGPDDIDALITHHATGLALPGLDVHLANRLGLGQGAHRHLSRTPMTQLGCAGGVQALIKAVDYTASHPGARVLVVCAETLGTLIHSFETSLVDMMYKGLVGDGAAACVVTSGQPSAPSIRVIEPTTDVWEYVLPDSIAFYSMTFDHSGQHFGSTKDALTAVDKAALPMLTWMRREKTEWSPDYCAIHPGGPRVLDRISGALDIEEHLLQESRASLRECGNIGCVSIFDVLARTFRSSIRGKAQGLLAAFGPGFTCAAIKGEWTP
ncbi:PhlD [Streptomyces sp. NRRL B-1347]|uniref:PhlD n=1 Tax=Streptomyces sp. NRRL B-1347 TaxID=1476877 RepID=UPI00131C2B37|nr:PhlD [Streptomyces sp. NRRL B-1347]